ncbi:hypothetical protein HJC23_011786 [Cyclotella cryptica]|uniref:Uncharacterized protein n=1 Tax=Cyclotella cryptica TaxID=29204 RepID=A0ABD3PIS5_9STRA
MALDLIMSSGQDNATSSGFTIPKKIPKKNRDAPLSAASLVPPRNDVAHHRSSTLKPASNGQPQPLKKLRSIGSESTSPPRESSPPPPSSAHIQIKSVDPLVIRIKTDGIPFRNSNIASKTSRIRRKSSAQSLASTDASPSPSDGIRTSGRKPRRKRYIDELENTDSDDFMTSGEEEEAEKRRMKRIAKKKQKKVESEPEPLEVEEEASFNHYQHGGNHYPLLTQNEIPGSIYDIEGPPSGELNHLWYSREPFLHVFVIDKILAWKTRPVTYLESCEPSAIAMEEEKSIANGDPAVAPKGKNLYKLGFDEAVKLKDMAILNTGNDFRKRMDISRINPGSCPHVKKLASNQEAVKTKKGDCAPKFKAVASTTEREEVLLIKWRGRSYLHCSWERKRDLEKFDHSTQLGSARAKISRFYQSQVMALGDDWKKVLEDGRKAASTPAGHHAHHSHTTTGATNGTPPSDVADSGDGAKDSSDEEEYFSPLYLEVERILGCDESEVDMNVLAKQRAVNIRDEKKALKKREKDDAEEEMWLKGETTENPDNDVKDREKSLSDIQQMEEDGIWDPEDNVRYIVKWKGLQLTDATWEYWLDIKRDFVDEVEDFWYRQKVPSTNEIKLISNASHPHPKDFKKMTESPLFGVSSKERPVAKLDDGEDSEATGDTDTGPVLKLRAYQLEGVNWLLWNWYNRRSCILADEMGLGKTIQSIGFLNQLQRIQETKIRGPFLVVAPLSLVSQWESESKEWAPDMNVVLYHGGADAREFLVKEEFYYTDQFTSKSTALSLRRKHITKFHVLITTYEIVLKDVSVLSKIHWKALIVDEAHRLKNIKSRLFEDLASVPRDFCLLLTGTPLQNSTEELWALLHFCDPSGFGSKDDFTAKFGQLTDASQVASLHTILRPYLLRRVKEDVEKALPPKEETILEVSLTPIQKSFYKAIYERNTSFLYKGAKANNAPSLMNVMMELRKCCNHPFLIRGAEDRIIGDAATTERKALAASNESNGTQYYIDYARLTGEQLVKSSGKFVLLSKLLPKLYDGGHKVLIFSQMVRVLDLLQELLQLKHYKYERLDGSTSASARNAAVDRFRRESFQRFVMLLSTRAGGLGLNLTAADTVIIFDSDWNPQNDLQAMARAHRIGQTRSVRVYRLLTAKTYEMHMFHSASLKLGLDRAVLAHQRQNVEETSSSKRKSKAEREEQAKEIDELLKKGAYDVFREDDDNEAQKFMETDIDQLLEQSSRKVTYGETATSSLSSGLGSFSKASFVASTGDGDGKDVDLDDPDFWAKAVGLQAPPEDMDPNMMLIIDDGSKRARKQVQVFDPHSEMMEAERKEKEKLEQEAQKEQERKDLLRLEKILRKEAEREEKRESSKRKPSRRRRKSAKSLSLKKNEKSEKAAERARAAKIVKAEREKAAKEVKIFYNERKTDRKRALKRAEHEDPVYERVKQAWDTTQRNRVVNAILRFGFGRFCKVRSESNFTSLPIQDIEVFARSYVYQLGLQAASTLLSSIDCGEISIDSIDNEIHRSLHNVLGSVVEAGRDFEWICQAILVSLCMHLRTKTHEAHVRLPLCLAEPDYVGFLGAAYGSVRCLHRISFLSRLNSIVEEATDRVIHDLGQDEMGRRGCPDCSTLDLDLKARHVSTEEIMYALGANLVSNGSQSVASEHFLTWDKSCDIGLVLGTFIHGLGNYEAMRHDEDLPFISRIKYYVSECNPSEAESHRRFEQAAAAARTVFDTALDTLKRKFQEQTTAAVAAVVAANKGTAPDLKSTYVVQSQKLDDDDIITVPRLKEAAVKAFREPCDPLSIVAVVSDRVGKGPGGREILVPYCPLPLPDSKHLDNLLLHIVNSIEDTKCGGQTHSVNRVRGSFRADVWTQPAPRVTSVGRSLFAGCLAITDKKRPLDNTSDYFSGAASPELASIAVGADSSRYERGSCVPLVVTRFGLGAILHADDSIVEVVSKSAVKKEGNGAVMAHIDPMPDDSNHTFTQPETDPPNKGNEIQTPSNLSQILVKEDNTAQQIFPAWQYIINDTKLRAFLCTSILFSGYPSSTPSESFSEASSDLLDEIKKHPSLSFLLVTTKTTFFSMEDAIGHALKAAGFDWSEKKESVEEYYQSVLFPHCLRLCLLLSGELNKIATLQGPSSLNGLNSIPDPFLPIECHSEEAMTRAYIILRRAKLMKALRFIVGGGVPFPVTKSVLHGPLLRRLTSEVPVWWCPWIHDLGLLVHAAFYGLESTIIELPCLQRPFIEQHIREVFINGENPCLPRCFLEKASENELNTWVSVHAEQFPTPNVIERRLALLCAELTRDTEVQYDHVPMFDEGGWPVATSTAHGFIGDTRTSGGSCLLVDVER